MKLLGITERKITKDKNGENVPHLEVVELILVHCNILNIIISEVQEYCIHLLQTNHLVVY